MRSAKKGDELRAGIFVLVGVVVFTVAIFLLGQKSALFSRTTELFVSFEDISGLVAGAPVRLAGLEVGSVHSISFPEDLGTRRARAKLVVQTRFMTRIRADSEAFIESAGLLGDKVVNIIMGSPTAAQLADGATLKTRHKASFEDLSTPLGQTVSSMASIAGVVEKAVKAERTEQLQEDLARSASSLASILGQVERGDGLVHRLIYDPALGEQAAVTLSELRLASQRAHGASTSLAAILSEVQHGDGTMHELFYGSEGKTALASLSRAAQGVDGLIGEVKSGNGLLHALVYDPEQRRLLDDLTQLSGLLKRMAEDVDKGRGTLGGLLRDPTVYEDLKTILGNVERNVLFKSLIRFTMENEQLRRVEKAPEVTTGRAASPAAAGKR